MRVLSLERMIEHFPRRFYRLVYLTSQTLQASFLTEPSDL